MNPDANPFNEKSADKILRNDAFGIDGIVVGVFVADWNGLPEGLTLKVAELSKKRNDGAAIQVVNVKIFPTLAGKCSIPGNATTVIIYNDGQEIARSVGLTSLQEIGLWLTQKLRLIPLKPTKGKAQPGKKRPSLRLES
jgi:hypothetical protein